MSEKRNPIQHSGETVVENVKRLRGSMQYKELSERLAAAGRPIPPLGLRRIENSERRVDVDDLMALAVVFGVSPLSLLLPSDGSSSLSSPLTGHDEEIGHNIQWLWGLGEEPLRLSFSSELSEGEITRFRLRAKPTIDEREVSGGSSWGTDSQSAATGAGADQLRNWQRQGWIMNDGNESSNGSA